MYHNKLKFLSLIIIICVLVTACRPNTVKDIQGNTYNTVTIGTQVWMAENLKATKYNDGTAIQMVADNDKWMKMTTSAYSWYNNDSTENKKTYGALYNWYVVDSKKLCPAGWHVPTDQDWMTLTEFMQGFSVAGGLIKEDGTKHWRSPNTEATNKSGFTALPGGYRSFEGAFNYLGISAYWWTTTGYNSSSAMFWNVRYKFSYIYKYRGEKTCGFSVRCLKDMQIQ